MNNQTSILTNTDLTDIQPTAVELTIAELDAVNGGTFTLLTNFANMRHEMLKAIVQNMRG